MPTVSSSRHTRIRSSSPTFSTSSRAFTGTVGQKLNVVTRVAIEGKANRGQDGASMKMYLKISLQPDNVDAGATVPLFAEENIKVITGQVHPIDINSAPYNFSSSACPMLHNAARALNLPTRSAQSYLSLFGILDSPPVASSRQSTSSSSSNSPPLDEKYTGRIIVSGYNVCFVLPKELPSHTRLSPGDTEVEGSSQTRSSQYRSRRGSVVDKGVVQFMAAIDIWVPYVSRPPRAPYLLSIPTPRCLSNNVKIRIFSPAATTASFASLSSAEEDAGTWDLTSDPHVTRTVSKRLARTSSYNNFADDESSDSSSASERFGLQGTFPSTDRIRVRWAAPLKTFNLPDGDGRKRVGVKEVQGEMTCAIFGKSRESDGTSEGLLMNIEFKGTCKGIWFPGVATMLGMDIGLEAKGSDVDWAPGSSCCWRVGGEAGYTGFDTGANSEPQELDSTETNVRGESAHSRFTSRSISRQDSSSPGPSLLRAPLPSSHALDYSFDGSATSSIITSSMSSLTPAPTSNGEVRSRAPSSSEGTDPPLRPPGTVTIHVNMNDLLPPAKSVFTFNISGSILVTPRARKYGLDSTATSISSHQDGGDATAVMLPRFSVLAADKEKTTYVVRNEVEYTALDVYNSFGDIRDAQTRKTVLQSGGFTKCGSEGGRVALRDFYAATTPKLNEGERDGRLAATSYSPNGDSRASSVSSIRQPYNPTRLKRDGPAMIPSLETTVIPLLFEDSSHGYAVRIELQAASNNDSDWLEFGFAQPNTGCSGSGLSEKTLGTKPQIRIVGTSLDGAPVRFEVLTAVKQEQIGDSGLSPALGKLGGKEWLNWVKVRVGPGSRGELIIDYVVKEETELGHDKREGKGRGKDEMRLDVLLPSFSLPVGRLLMEVESHKEAEVSSLISNLEHEHHHGDSVRLMQFSLDELFSPRLSLTVRSKSLNPPGRSLVSRATRVLAWGIPVALALSVILLIFLRSDSQQELASADFYTESISFRNSADQTVIVTTTVTAIVVPSPQKTPPPTPGHDRPSVPSSPLSSDDSTTTSLFSSTPDEASEASLTDGDLYSLMPFNAFPFWWPLRFDLPVFQVGPLPSARETMDIISKGVRLLWRGARRIYHYPLDPP